MVLQQHPAPHAVQVRSPCKGLDSLFFEQCLISSSWVLILGIIDPALAALASCSRSKKNECRKLHTLIHAEGRTFPVEISSVPTPVRVLSGKPKIMTTAYPVLLLSSWLRQCFNIGGKMVLGGFSLSDEDQWRPMFRQFWEGYKYSRPDLDLYSRSDIDTECTIPIQIHGDEGRGKNRRAVMVVSYQPLIGCRGPTVLNSSGHTAQQAFLCI